MLELSKDNKQSIMHDKMSCHFYLYMHLTGFTMNIPLFVYLNGYPNRSGESSSEERCMVQERRDFLEKLTQIKGTNSKVLVQSESDL